MVSGILPSRIEGFCEGARLAVAGGSSLLLLLGDSSATVPCSLPLPSDGRVSRPVGPYIALSASQYERPSVASAMRYGQDES